MRLIYFDIDTLRADHLGCYGYGRATSPAIDAVARRGIRFENVHASDTPCLPSRSALCSGQFGIRNGVVNHGGAGTDPFPEGRRRGFRTAAATHGWMAPLRDQGVWTASISTFAERHSAYHFEAGFNECINIGTRGTETADQVAAVAEEWLARNAWREDWFLHVHLWDPHTPYRTPASFGDPFAGDPVPTWLTEEVRAAHWLLPGPHSAQEVAGFGPRDVWDRWPRQPVQVAGMDDVRRVYDGYDTGVRFADHHVGRLLEMVDGLGLTDETAVMVSADHGENLGELGIYCDHQTADQFTTRVPLILAWPGMGASRDGTTPRVETGLHYQIDVMATVLELAGGVVPDGWDGASFAADLMAGRPSGRDHLVLSHAAWTAQRAVRFGRWICIRTYYDAFHGFPEVLLFDLEADPYEQHDVAGDHPDVVRAALADLSEWGSDALSRSTRGVDPLWTVLTGGGPWHGRVDVARYLDRLRETGRGAWAKHFEAAGWPRARGTGPAFLDP
ncbi:MAG: sulfatase [Acidimicrobiales bacterium]|jgi:arylsulfatase A-like enzyme